MKQPKPAYVRLPAALDLLERRAILPGQDGFTTRQLAKELSRRGWRLDLGADDVSATKAYPPPGIVPRTIAVLGPDQVTNLVVLLADVIRFDEEHGLTLTKPYRADIVVRAPDERVVALVEVKNGENLSSEVALAFRRDLLADNRLDLSIPFFLYVSQEMGFLWDNRSAPHPYAEPNRQFPLESVVAHYWPWFNAMDRLSGLALEVVMRRWLNDLALLDANRPVLADRFFDGTDFLDALRGATIDAGALV